MAEIPRQHLQVVQSGRMGNVGLVSSDAGQVSVGAGTLRVPSMPSPVSIQFIPQPTQAGQYMAEGVSQLAGSVSKIAYEYATTQAKTAATSKAANDAAELDSLLLGTNEDPGILLQKGEDYISNYPLAKQSVEAFYNDKISKIEGSLEKSFYIAEVAKNKTTVQTQLRDSFKSEYVAARTQMAERADSVNVNNAIKVAYDPISPTTVKAQLDIAISERMEYRGEDLGTATDTIMIRFAKELLGQPEGNDKLNTYLGQGLFDRITTGARVELRDAQMDDAKYQSQVRNIVAEQEEIGEELYWSTQMTTITEELHKAAKQGPEAFNAYAMEKQLELLQADPDGSLAKPFQALIEVLDYEAPENIGTVGLMQHGLTYGIPPTKLAQMAKTQGINIPLGSYKAYVEDFRVMQKEEIGHSVKNWRDRVGGYIVSKMGLSAGGEYFIASPEGQAFIAQEETRVRRRFQEAFLEGGITALDKVAEEEARRFQTPGYFGSSADLHQVNYNLIDTLPEVISPLFALRKLTGADPVQMANNLADLKANDFATVMMKEFDLSAEEIQGGVTVIQRRDPSVSDELAHFYLMWNVYKKRFVELGLNMDMAMEKKLKAQFDLIQFNLLQPGSSSQIPESPKSTPQTDGKP